MHPIILYDGVCGLCNRLVQFIVRHDRDETFRFAALQGPFAAGILSRHGMDQDALDTFYVVLNGDPPGAEAAPTESLLSRADAVIFILSQLGVFWRFNARILGLVPRPLREWSYNLIARNRYRIFGRYDTCPVPGPTTSTRFLDR